MVTKDQLENKINLNFEHISLTNKDGTPVRRRASGKLKTWKTRVNAFKLPVKYGLRTSFYITNENAHEWNLV